MVAAFGLGLGANIARAADSDVFTVADVVVDTTAETASAARDQAVAAGQRAAWARLAERLVVSSDLPKLRALGPAPINDLVRDFEIADEKTSSVRYLARLLVRFRPDAVRDYLRQAAVGFAETRSKPVLVLPVFEQDGTVVLWEEPNPWRSAWQRLPASDGLVPLLAPLGDLQDIAAISGDQALTGDDARLRAIATRYGASDVLIVRAGLRVPEPPPGEAVAQPVLQVTMSRFGTTPVEQTRVETYQPGADEELQPLLARVAGTLAQQIQESWKLENQLRFGASHEIAVRVPIGSLGEWLEIKRRLQSIASVRGTDLVALSRGGAQLRLRYLGDDAQLRLALSQSDLVLDRGATSWILRLGGRPGAGEPAAEPSADQPGAREPGGAAAPREPGPGPTERTAP